MYNYELHFLAHKAQDMQKKTTTFTFSCPHNIHKKKNNILVAPYFLKRNSAYLPH